MSKGGLKKGCLYVGMYVCMGCVGIDLEGGGG